MATAVLDSSAVLALLFSEPGAETVKRFSAGAAMSAVNVQEVAKKLFDRRATENDVRGMLENLNLQIVPHTFDDALAAAALIQFTRRHGCGLGDRTCMALAARLGVPAVTTDRSWAQLNIPGLTVQLAR
jgi:PIN domain nuclease of toxin-antitoxin system